MTIAELLDSNRKILMEGAVVERMRRSEKVQLHHDLVISPLIYSAEGGKALENIYSGYIEIAKKSDIPLFLCTPTWRADRERIERNPAFEDVNIDASHFMKRISQKSDAFRNKIKIGGLIGCKNDCYKPQEALSIEDAMNFHSWQIGQLAESSVDFLMAQTFPALCEAMGVAKIMERSGKEYIISFVINKKGEVLDGTPLEEAIEKIDSFCTRKPVGYMVNCTYPTSMDESFFSSVNAARLIGFLANASSQDHCVLDGSTEVYAESIETWSNDMTMIHKRGVKVLGGCCGTDETHIESLIEL